jgi:hypothetical protein
MVSVIVDVFYYSLEQPLINFSLQPLSFTPPTLLARHNGDRNVCSILLWCEA